MPRYFFDIQDGIDIRDEVGREIADSQRVRSEAVKVICGLLAAEAEDSDGHTLVLSVRDEQGNVVMTIRTVCQVEKGAKPALKLVS